MSADWKAGDRAVCVEPFSQMAYDHLGYCHPTSSDTPKVGAVYLVEEVKMGHTNLLLVLCGLMLDERCDGYRAYKFRKVVPACDRMSLSEEAKA